MTIQGCSAPDPKTSMGHSSRAGVGHFSRALKLLAELGDRPGRFGGLKAVDGEYLYFTWHQTFSDIWVMDLDW